MELGTLLPGGFIFSDFYNVLDRINMFSMCHPVKILFANIKHE